MRKFKQAGILLHNRVNEVTIGFVAFFYHFDNGRGNTNACMAFVGAGCLGCGGRLVDWHPLEVSWILIVFGIKINLWEDIALRGRPYMTSARFSGFWTPPLSAFGTDLQY